MGLPDIPTVSIPDIPAFADLIAIFAFIVANTGVGLALICLFLLWSGAGGRGKGSADSSQTTDVTNLGFSLLLALGILVGVSSAFGSPVPGLPSIGAPINWDKMPTVHIEAPSSAPTPHAP